MSLPAIVTDSPTQENGFKGKRARFESPAVKPPLNRRRLIRYTQSTSENPSPFLG
jgi:hypothetical protein